MLLPFILRLVIFSILALQALGQNSNQTFGWKFREDFLSTKLQACFELRLVVFPNPKNATAGSFSGVPPYYIMAFPQRGQPTTTFVGDNNDTLAWTPNYPVGTQLILQMLDSTGNTGGTSGSVFEIVENPNSNSCISPPPPNDFTITSNITQDGKATLETCQSWRLDIHGGTPPYKVVLDARNSPVITNITVPATDNAVVFVNRADPGTVLFGVLDASQRWATGTQFVTTTGSTDFSCIGHGTITTTQQELNSEDAQRNAAKEKRRTSIIVGVVVAVVVLLLIAGGVWIWLMRRKKAQELEEGEDTLPRQFVETGASGQILSINSFLPSGASTTSSPNKASFSPGAHTLSYASEPYNPYHESSSDSNRLSSVSGQGANLQSRPSFANFPRSSIRPSKAAEAARESEIGSSSARASGSADHPIWPARSGSLGRSGDTNAPTENEFIYQHQDAGQVVRELPPPYIAPPDVASQDSPDRRP